VSRRIVISRQTSRDGTPHEPASASAQTSRNLSNAALTIGFCRGVATPWSCASLLRATRTEPTNRLGLRLHDLNLAIPSAVMFRRSLFRLSLVNWPMLPTSKSRSCELCSGRLRQRGAMSGRFRGRKLVRSGRYSKSFFAGVQCFMVMPPLTL
jgi:hypothetical protein